MCFFGLGFGIAEFSSVFRLVHAFVHRRAILGLLYFAVSLRYKCFTVSRVLYNSFFVVLGLDSGFLSCYCL